MARIRPLHMRGRAIGDCQQLFNTGPSLHPLNAGITLPQRLFYDAGHAFARRAGNSLRELVGLRVFDVEAHNTPPFCKKVQRSTILPVKMESCQAQICNANAQGHRARPLDPEIPEAIIPVWT